MPRAASHRRVRRAASSQPGGTSVSLFSSTTSCVPAAIDADVHRGDETLIAPVAHQFDASRGSQPVEPRGQFRLRRTVVHHDHAPCRPIGSASTDKMQRRVCCQAAIDRYDDVHHDTRRWRSATRRRSADSPGSPAASRSASRERDRTADDRAADCPPPRDAGRRNRRHRSADADCAIRPRPSGDSAAEDAARNSRRPGSARGTRRCRRSGSDRGPRRRRSARNGAVGSVPEAATSG